MMFRLDARAIAGERSVGFVALLARIEALTDR